MSLDLLQKDLEEKSFRRLYYLYGSEPYLKRFYMKSLISAVLPDNADIDLHRYEGKGLSVERFSEELWLCPSGQYKVMQIFDLPCSSPVAEFLAEDCEIGDDTIVLICQQTEPTDLRTSAFKALKKRMERDGLVVEIKTVDDATLARWVTQQFRRSGCTIAPTEVQYFLSVEERNMEFMLTEISKISAYCHGHVTREALELLCVKTVQARAYELNDLLLEKNADKAFSVFNDLKALRTPPQMILGSLFSCFGNLYKLKVLESMPERVREQETGLKPYAIRKYAGYLSKISLPQLNRLMDACARIDVLSKSTGTDADLLVLQLLREALEVL